MKKFLTFIVWIAFGVGLLIGGIICAVQAGQTGGATVAAGLTIAMFFGAGACVVGAIASFFTTKAKIKQ